MTEGPVNGTGILPLLSSVKKKKSPGRLKVSNGSLPSWVEVLFPLHFNLQVTAVQFQAAFESLLHCYFQRFPPAVLFLPCVHVSLF